MKIKIDQQVIYEENINCVEDSYIFAPSISQQRTISGKTYTVRRFFRGGQDFETTMKRFASEQFYKERR